LETKVQPSKGELEARRREASGWALVGACPVPGARCQVPGARCPL